ncbi:S8 family serine peptidase, partial [Staphylococcus aureus]
LSARGYGSVADIAEAIRFAANHGAKVINMSLGGSRGSKILGDAVKYAHDRGVTVVCAAGNEGRGRVGFPAAYPGAIAVAA